MAAELRTVFYVHPFKRGKKGHLVRDAEQAFSTKAAAIRSAQRFADRGLAAIAFARECNLEMGDYEEPTVLAECGTIPPGILEACAQGA